MRLPELALLLVASLGLGGCSVSWSRQQPPPEWTAGFWYWRGSSTDNAWTSETLDVLFVHAGTIRTETFPRFASQAARPDRRWYVSGVLPDELPPAREYWLVFRFEEQGVPDLRVAPALAGEVSQLRAAARKRQLNVVGVQLDIDSPTSALSQYASFLREVRKALPPDCEISITALLDWFRNGAAIAEVIKEVDEFVPQFYDVAGRESPDSGGAIAAAIDPARWGPVFNRFRKRFRVGISTFGRSRKVPGAPRPTAPYLGVAYFRDLAPISVATNPAFQAQVARNQANEVVLTYRATRRTRVGYNEFDAGDAVQFILPTPDTVRAAVESARRMKGRIAGVVFFRWPGSDEALVMQPVEVLVAAGLAAGDRRSRNRIHVIDGRCAAVECVDVYLESLEPLSPAPRRYIIRTSTELEYFLPEQGVPVRMTGPSRLELSLPPYCGRARLYIGRAVTSARAEFTVAEGQ